MERLPEEVFNLLNLHYLGLDKTGINELPKSIGRLQNLQFLYSMGTQIVELPNELTKLQRLGVLKVTHGFPSAKDGSCFFNGVMPPKQICKLKNLRAVGVIKVTNEMVRNFGTLTKLTRLNISEIRSKHCEDLFTAISKFSQLEWLFVKAKDGEVLQLQALDTSTSVIIFSGQLERTAVSQFSWSLQHHNGIRELVLHYSCLDQNSFFCLQEIRSLRALCLVRAYDGNELCFDEMSFLMFQELEVEVVPNLQRIEINKGAMPNLKKLHISNCPGLKEVPQGIEYLSKLEDFVWNFGGDQDSKGNDRRTTK